MNRLKLLRLASNRSQWDIATAIGISQGRYSMIERGLIPPTAEERARLAAVLAVPANSLFRAAVKSPTQRRQKDPARKETSNASHPAGQ
jgi:transcriptional regulator with XRE-family HTH domain